MTVSTLAFLLALFGWVPLVVLLSVRLRRADKDIDALRQDLTQTARDAAKTDDDLTDLRGEYLAQARALDAHDERLQALEVR